MATTREAKIRCRKLMSHRNKKSSRSSNLNESLTKPDCVVCFETVVTRGKLSVCDHWFCFACIYEWSKLTNTCPLCKERFRCITKTGTQLNCSPPKSFRIKDKNQKVITDSDEDREAAFALAEDLSSVAESSEDEDYSPSFVTEDDLPTASNREARRPVLRSSTSPPRFAAYENSFIDDQENSIDMVSQGSLDSDSESSSSEETGSLQGHPDARTILTRSSRNQQTRVPLLLSPCSSLSFPSTSNADAEPRARQRPRRRRTTRSTRTEADARYSQPQANLNGWIDMTRKGTERRIESANSSDESRPPTTTFSSLLRTSASSRDILATPLCNSNSEKQRRRRLQNDQRRVQKRVVKNFDLESEPSDKENIVAETEGSDDEMTIRSPTIISRNTKKISQNDYSNSTYNCKASRIFLSDCGSRNPRIASQSINYDILDDESSDEELQRRRKHRRKRICI